MDTGWLIERTGSLEWLAAVKGNFAWTADSTQALCFCRKKDAEQVATLAPDPGFVTEHQWG